MSEVAALCASSGHTPLDLDAALLFGRRAIGARTAVLVLCDGGSPRVHVSGADQHGLAIWCRQACARISPEMRADPEATRAHLAPLEPEGVETVLLPGVPVPGLLAARGFRTRETPERSRASLSIVADLIGLAMARRGAELARGRAHRHALVLSRLLAGLEGQLDLDAVFEAIAAGVADMLDVTRLSIVLAEAGDSEYRHAVSFDEHGQRVARGVVPVSRTVTQALSDLEVHVNGDIRGSDDESCRDLVRRGIVSTLVAPLVVDGRALGTLNAGSSRAHAFSPVDARRLQQLADDVAGIVASALAVADRRRDAAEAPPAMDRARLASIGQLAAGVAHEVNNPLAVVLSNLQSLAEGSGDGVQEAQEMLKESISAVERIAEVVRALRDLAAEDDGDAKEVDPVYAVRSAVRVVENQIELRAHLELDLRPTPTVRADSALITQLVVQLLARAAEHLQPEQRDTNRIRVRTRSRGAWVSVVVRDNGPGLGPGELVRMFDPSVSGEGTASLAAAAEVARQLGGGIDVRSRPEVGTRFELTLPAALETSIRRSSLPPSDFRARLRGRVLVIDDEPAVLRAFTRILRPRHDVVAVASGAEALRVLEADQHFDAVLCDVMMPDVDGPAVFEAMRRNWPALCARVLFCTGGEFTERAARFLKDVSNPVLRKPVGADQLREAVGRVVGLAQRLLREDATGSPRS